MSADTELLTGLSHGELEALAESMLAPAAQARLDELLARNKDNRLSASEEAELERLLNRVDQLGPTTKGTLRFVSTLGLLTCSL